MTSPALRLVSGGQPAAFPVATASRDLERAWQALRDAEEAWAASPLGDTSELFLRADAWHQAINDYARARLKLAEALARREGRTRLRLVGGRDA